MSDYINTKKSALFLLSGATLPVPPANFLEQTEEFVVNPQPTVEEYNRISARLGTTDSYADTCHVTMDQTVKHMMRTQNKAGTAFDTVPSYGELLKVCGFDESVTSAVGMETVIYKSSQSPAKGSAVMNIDGHQYTATDTVVGDATFIFEIGKPAMIEAKLSGFFDNQGIPTAVASPTVTLSDEDLLIMSCADIMLADGTSVEADKITITMGAEIAKKYALNAKDFSINDYVIKMTADFSPENVNYADAITKLNAGTVEAILISLGTDQTGALINGKSVEIKANYAKASTFTDSIQDSNVKRSFTWILQAPLTESLRLKMGYFAP